MEFILIIIAVVVIYFVIRSSASKKAANQARQSKPSVSTPPTPAPPQTPVKSTQPPKRPDSDQPTSSTPKTAPTNSPFYIRGVGESLNSPIHIHFDSFKPLFEPNINAPFLGSRGTFLVTVTGDNYRPRGITNRCTGVNCKLTREGVADGIVAHVLMVKDTGEGPIESVVVTLHENGTVAGFLQHGDRKKEVDLADVYFSYGDTVFLGSDGEPLGEMHTPQPTERQRRFMQKENDRMVENILNS